MTVNIETLINEFFCNGNASCEMLGSANRARTGIAICHQVMLHPLYGPQKRERLARFMHLEHNAPLILQTQSCDDSLTGLVEEEFSNRSAKVFLAKGIQQARNRGRVSALKDF